MHKKGVNIVRATWQCHVDARASLRGKDVTWTRIISLFNRYIGLPFIGRRLLPPLNRVAYIFVRSP